MKKSGPLEAAVKVSDVMTRDVLSVSPEDRLRRAATIMRENRIGGLLVVDDGRAVGMITESDLLNMAAESPDGKRHGSWTHCSAATVRLIPAPSSGKL